MFSDGMIVGEVKLVTFKLKLHSIASLETADQRTI